jgi:hypothetical protein
MLCFFLSADSVLAKIRDGDSKMLPPRQLYAAELALPHMYSSQATEEVAKVAAAKFRATTHWRVSMP